MEISSSKINSNFNNKKALITGGLGLTGSHLARKLVSLGSIVTILTRSLNDIKNIYDIKDKVEIIIGDIRDLETINKAIIKKDFIFHLASQSSVQISMENPFLDLDTNYKATLNILESCRKNNLKAIIVYAGTIREAGKIKEILANENQREDPTSVFDLHKLASEKLLKIYSNICNLNTTSLRFPNIFGEGQYNTDPHRSVINHIVKKAVNDKFLEIYGDGGPLRDYCHVSNIVDAILISAQSKITKGEYYIIGSGEGRTFKDFIDSLKTILKDYHNLELIIKKIPTPIMIDKTAQGNITADISKFNQATNWKPAVSFDEGLKRTIKFYLNKV
jgi:UDP-glucose 4-epimerase